MRGVHWRAAASVISLEILLKDLDFGGPKCYRGTTRARLLPRTLSAHRLHAYRPATLGMNQQDNGSQRRSEGECIMGTYYKSPCDLFPANIPGLWIAAP